MATNCKPGARPIPNIGMGRHKFNGELYWYFCEMESEMGLSSNQGAQLDALFIGIGSVHSSTSPDTMLDVSAKSRRIVAGLHSIPYTLQRTLKDWYCETNRRNMDEMMVARAHQEYREAS